MYLDHRTNPIDFENHSSQDRILINVNVIFFVSRPKFTKLCSSNVEKNHSW